MSKESPRNHSQSVLAVIVLALLLYMYSGWSWIIKLAIVIGLLGGTFQSAGRIIDIVWRKMTWIPTRVIPHVLLTAIYFFLLTPLAYLSKMGTKDPLRLKNNCNSLFLPNREKIDKNYFEKLW